MELLERDREREALETAIEESALGGRVVVVAGEAGIGKTALVSALARRAPRAVGRLRPADHAAADGAAARRRARRPAGALAEAVEGSREDLLSAVLDELREPAALVVEDLHWADDATLDFVALLGRRLPRSRGCLILTCRPDLRAGGAARARRAAARVRAHASSPARCRRRRSRCWRARAGRDAADLHATSGGNPFFVTEVLAAPAGERVPASVRDAVALRAAAAGPEARAVAELAAVVPGPGRAARS